MVDSRWFEEHGTFSRGTEVTRADGQVTLQLPNGSLIVRALEETWPCNPAKWDHGAEDNASLPFLHEPGVCSNLATRYQQDLIYASLVVQLASASSNVAQTWSGLFLIAVNPYKDLKGLYAAETIKSLQKPRQDGTQPHIYAVAQAAWQELAARRQSQAILVTGESGAGKTVNTKHLLTYLTAVATSPTPSAVHPGNALEQRILEANPILEAFGNASTVRNNNSSRFGKFIRLDFSQAGLIIGARIQTYLLEKSRIVSRHAKDRSFHIFYQLLDGADADLRAKLLLDSDRLPTFRALCTSSSYVPDINDKADFSATLAALRAFGLSETECFDHFRVVATVLHLTNIELGGTTTAHVIPSHALEFAARLLGLPGDGLNRGLLQPTMTAGAAKELVSQSRTPQQAMDEVGALCKTLYERNFGILVGQINQCLGEGSSGVSEGYIGILDIAGFEIFDKNSFEQLLINHTNERLQQLFNAHFFQREQELYLGEGLEWESVDYGLNLQPTVDLIEGLEPLGILAILDDECIIPQGSDQEFSRKLSARFSSLAEGHSDIFAPFRVVEEGFTIRHYAGAVQYSTQGWLKKNRDPLNADLMNQLAHSSVPYIANIFRDGLQQGGVGTGKVKKGIFRTLGQRHKEELTALVADLETLQLHFVRCIVPNVQKRAHSLDTRIVLEQLRCNGVIEGLRIARQGFPNRLAFAEFCNRYGVLARESPSSKEAYNQERCLSLCRALDIAVSEFGIGKSRLFLKAGVPASLEDRRDALLFAIFSRFQAVCRRRAVLRSLAKLRRREAALQGIQHTAKVYAVRPLLVAAPSAETVHKKDLQTALSKQQSEHHAQQKHLLERLAAQERETERMLSAVMNEREAAHAKDAQTQRLARGLASVQQQLVEANVELDRTTASVSILRDALKTAEDTQQVLEKKLRDALHAADDANIISAAVEEQRLSLENALLKAEETTDTLHAEKQALQQQVEDITSRLQQSAASNDTLHARLQVIVVESEANVAAAKVEASQDQQKLQDAMRSVGEAQWATRHLESTIADFERSLASKEAELLRALDATSAMKVDREQEGKKLARLCGEMAAMAVDCKAAKASELAHRREAKESRETLQALQATIASTTNQTTQHKEALRSAEAANEKLIAEIAAMRKERNEAEVGQAAEVAKLRSQIDAMATQLDDKHQILQVAQQEAEDARDRSREAEKDARSANAGRSAAESALQELRIQHEHALRQIASSAEETGVARDALKHALQRNQDLENALVTTEAERSRRDQQSRQLADALSSAFADVSKLQAALRAAEKHSASSTAASREAEGQRALLKEANDELQRKLSDALALQDQRVVQHVHVLEKAKKFTDKELSEAKTALEASQSRTKQLEKDKKRLLAELEDASALLSSTTAASTALQITGRAPAAPVDAVVSARTITVHERSRSRGNPGRSDVPYTTSSATSEEARLRRELDEAKKALVDAVARRQSLEVERDELLQLGKMAMPTRQADDRPAHRGEMQVKRLAEAEAANRRLSLRLAEEQSQREGLEVEMSDKLARLQRSYQSQLEEASTELDLALSRAARLQEDLTQLQLACDAAERSGDKRRSLASDWQQERQSLTQRIDFLSKAFDDSSRRQRDGQSRLAEASSEIRDLRLQADRLLAETRALADAKQEADARLQEIASEICETNDHIISSSEAARILKLERDGLRQQLTIADDSLQREQERRRKAEMQLVDARSASSQERAVSLAAKQHSADLQRLVHTLRLQITDLEGRSVAAASRVATSQAAQMRIAVLEGRLRSSNGDGNLLKEYHKLQEDLQGSRAHATMLEGQCSRLELAVRQHDAAPIERQREQFTKRARVTRSAIAEKTVSMTKLTKRPRM